jgi:23S rRNA (uracil1939-C5)-methyltransferase
MQHVDERTQVAAKQRVLEDALWHVGRVRPETMLRPLHGLPWGYRHRARLSARWVEKKGGSLVGFRERKSTYVTDMTSCEVLPPKVSGLIRPLRALIDSLAIRERVPQIEVAVGEGTTVLVLRVLEPVGAEDAGHLKRFADEHAVQLWLQPEGPDSARPFWPLEAAELHYTLPQYGVRIAFGPTDFTQVNHAVNRLLVSRALGLLDPRPGERITDFFCGLGNFTLPIARSGADVLGVEGSVGLLARAQANARANGLADTCGFAMANLFEAEECARLPGCNKAVLDPPREGAIELVKSFEAKPPSRIVYVACDPGTLARDAGVLVNTLGYRLAAAGVVNMFPHTSHVESIALFERQ